ncbi:MAG: MBL fold metallo-hydrolase [Bacteroidetes bacterium]|nr:MBL fold metallo-hydrolase [Bacteroidota bacterium]
MKVEQMYTNCLAEAAYYIESDGEAAIIDPIRETTPYLEKLKSTGAKLKYVFETHFHADFVSGHIDLAKQTGAKIIFGPLAETNYEVQNANDEEFFSVGKVRIKVLHTPGHTPESSCFLLLDEKGKEHCIFTGDTLFIGDVGRPDLLDGKMTSAQLASMLYDSLNNKIKNLPDDVIVYPAHGAGSACGKNISKESFSTLGEQKKTNYALQNMSRENFIKAVTTGLSSPPPYFFKDAMINKNGYDNIDDVMKRNMKPLSTEELKKEIFNGTLILDTRDPDAFEKGFIKGSMNIGLSGQYAVWIGTLIDISQPLVIVAEEGKEHESILRAARVGFENVKGFLKGGITSWISTGNITETIQSITPKEFAEKIIPITIGTRNQNILDVRKPSEYESGHVKNATLFELSSSFKKNLHTLDKEQSYFVHCARGYRSMIASSILKANGFKNIINVYEGYAGIKNTNVPIELPAETSI